jgi:tetratricopeptide (TPR) repeat protein
MRWAVAVYWALLVFLSTLAACGGSRPDDAGQLVSGGGDGGERESARARARCGRELSMTNWMCCRYGCGRRQSTLTVDQASRLLGQANTAFHRGAVEHAIALYDEALQQNPHDYMGFYRRALAHLSVGRLGRALRDFDTTLRLNPDLDHVYVQRAQLLLKQGWFDQAQRDLERVYDRTRAAPLAKTLHHVRQLMTRASHARQLMQRGQFREALDVWDDVLREAPAAIEQRWERAECFVQLREYERAISDLK